ncbi:MAG: type II toxin-antitoxin system RelE/ParE family toxin [Betaproteobacteria bacterium]
MIKRFKHKGLEAFFRRGTKAGVQAHHAAKLRILLTALDYAKKPDDMNAPGWRLHALRGDRKGFFSVTVNGNWRITFRFDGKDADLVDYLDYH